MSGNISFTAPPAPPADLIAPYVVSLAFNVAGTELTVVHTEAVNYGGGLSAGWTLTSDGAALVATYKEGNYNTNIIFNLNRTVYAVETITASYSSVTGDWQDGGANPVVSTNNMAVVNNSTQVEPAMTYVFYENFEPGGTNYAVSGTCDLTYDTYKLEGTNSCLLSSGNVITNALGTTNDLYGYLRMQHISSDASVDYGTGLAIGTNFLGMRAITVEPYFFVAMRHGTAGITNMTYSFELLETNHVWWHWKAATSPTASNGVFQLWVTNNTGVIPTIPLIDYANGTDDSTPTVLTLVGGTAVFTMDTIRITSSSAILTDNPE